MRAPLRSHAADRRGGRVVRTIALCGALAAAGCGRHPVREAAIPDLGGPIDAEGLVVRLAWAADVDLDAYVTDPAGETAYYGNPRTRSGGRVERDLRCGEVREGVRTETVRWTTPPAGRYRIGVDFPAPCTTAPIADVPFRLVIDAGGRRTVHDGRVRRTERLPAVITVEVH